MLSFMRHTLTRSNTSHLETLAFDNGRSSAWFKHDASSPTTQPVIAVNRLPACLPGDEVLAVTTTTTTTSAGPGTANSALAPPLHYHHTQAETFLIKAGHAAFYTYHPPSSGVWGIWAPFSSYVCKVEVAGPEQSVLIPKGVVHTFRNASSDSELELEFVLSPTLSSPGATGLTAEEMFFRNTWSYRQDCAKAVVQRSLLQVMCFNWQGGVVLMLPGCGRLLSGILGCCGALFGRYLVGYRYSYDEYARNRLQ
ncbi:hypothetical protein AC578_2248 [Pseudocercospora eumusae]|uniref:Uncharacterized protein n=1 Tax=Pseudocercospora eumusae TaxID=321146 RepID=A0A139GUS8_9PEZI|nr:hypothetical protein AC578_2248 [Pseudocercospora eumusae]